MNASEIHYNNVTFPEYWYEEKKDLFSSLKCDVALSIFKNISPFECIKLSEISNNFKKILDNNPFWIEKLTHLTAIPAEL